jgi:hypothetical protein
MAAIAPVPASLTCRNCRSRMFFAQMAESGNFLVLVCIGCTRPLLFSVEPLNDFPTQEIVLEACEAVK